MCDFCEQNKIISFKSGEQMKCQLTKNQNGYLLIIFHIIDGGIFGEVETEDFINFNYCPFCGRKLEDRENV